jgi:hypothetical protein
MPFPVPCRFLGCTRLLSPGQDCPEHPRVIAPHPAPYRAKTKARGYGASHQQKRAMWEKRVNRGEVGCWRCGGQIIPGTPWHLGHQDDRSLPALPEHERCNVVAAGSKGRSNLSP